MKSLRLGWGFDRIAVLIREGIMSKEPKKENPLDRLKDVLKTPTMPVHELPAKKDKKSP